MYVYLCGCVDVCMYACVWGGGLIEKNSTRFGATLENVAISRLPHTLGEEGARGLSLAGVYQWMVEVM